MNQHNDIEVVWRPDVTVATIVPRDGRFLVVEERIRGELVVNQPAGHLEPHESLADAAKSLAQSETLTIALSAGRHCSNANDRCAPAGILRSACAASIAMVPAPQHGSVSEPL
jgi:hypothetical protein